jgi:N-acetylmuramoyl-L-alanine amidase
VITDEQTGCGHRTACRYANRKHPACEATPAMKPRPARAKTPRPRKEPNTDRGLNERVAREKPDRESPPNSKKRRVHLCSCSRVRRPRSLRGNTASRGGIIDPGHSGSDAGSRRNIHHFKLPGSAPFQFLNWTGMWHLREKEENPPNAVTVLLRCAFANKPRAVPPFPNS